MSFCTSLRLPDSITELVAKVLIATILIAFTMTINAQESGQESRIDFGNAYVQGQSIKSGAIYLTNRRKSQLKSLLKTRKSYRYEIVKDFYGGEVELRNIELEPQPDSDQQTDK